MTFCVAVGVADFGLCASDVAARFRPNVRRLAGGWLTSTGDVVMLERMYREIATLPAAEVDAIRAIVQRVGAEYIGRSARSADDDQVTRGQILTVYRDAQGFAAANFRADGLTARRTDQLVTWPPGVDPQEAAPRDEAFSEFISGSWDPRLGRRVLDGPRPGPWETIRRIAELCAFAFEGNPTPEWSDVSGELEIGLTLGERGLYLRPTPTAELLAVDDRCLVDRFDLQGATCLPV